MNNELDEWFDEWYKINIEDWVSKTYRAWRSGILEQLESALEKREQAEGENE